MDFLAQSTVKNIYVNNEKVSKDLVIPDGVKFISASTFSGFDWIESVDIPGSVEYIDANAFGRCSNLQRVNISEGVKEIYGTSNKKGNTWYSVGAFGRCNKLQYVSIPSTVTMIGKNAFSDSPSLDSIDCYITEPFETSCFSNGQFLASNLIVPKGTSDRYKNTEGWKNFVNIYERDAISFELKSTVSTGGHVNLNGVLLGANTTIYQGENYELEFIPDDGYELKSLVINGEDVTSNVTNNFYTVTSISKNMTIVVTFAELPLYLTIKSAESGSIVQEAEKGKTYKFTITPSDDWQIESVSFNGTDVTSQLNDNKYTTPAITANSELIVVYKQAKTSTVKAIRQLSDVKVSASYGTLSIDNNGYATSVYVFNIDGSQVASESVGVGTSTIELPTNKVYIVKVGEETFKVTM